MRERHTKSERDGDRERAVCHSIAKIKNRVTEKRERLKDRQREKEGRVA